MLSYIETNPDAEKTILFLHGATASGAMWSQVATALPDFNSVLVDLPGHGASNTVKLKDFADAAGQVRELVDHLKAGSLTVVGLSLGAYVTLELLASGCSKIERAVITGVSIKPLPAGWLMMVIAHVMRPFLRFEWLIRKNAKSMGIPEEMLETYIRDWKRADPGVFVDVTRAACRYSVSRETLASRVPILVLAGSREPESILSSVQSLPAQMINAQGFILPDAGHAWSALQPDLCADIIGRWIEDGSPPESI